MSAFKHPPSFNLRGKPIHEQPTLLVPALPLPERSTARLRPVRTRPLPERVTVKLPAVTQPLVAVQATQPLPAPGEEEVTDKRAVIRPPLLCQIEECARADGITHYEYLARLLHDDRRRRIARDVEELL